MALSVIQSTAKKVVDASGNFALNNFLSLPTVGHGIVVSFVSTSNAITTVTDNQSGNTYVLAKKEIDTVSGQTAYIFLLAAVVGSTGTFTISITQTAAYTLAVASEASAGLTLDQVGQAHSASGGGLNEVLTFTTPVTAFADELCFAAMTVDGSSTNEAVTTATIDGVTATNLANEQDASAHVVGSLDYRVLSSAGTKAVSWTVGDHYLNKCGCCATFKDSSAVAIALLPIFAQRTNVLLRM